MKVEKMNKNKNKTKKKPNRNQKEEIREETDRLDDGEKIEKETFVSPSQPRHTC